MKQDFEPKYLPLLLYVFFYQEDVARGDPKGMLLLIFFALQLSIPIEYSNANLSLLMRWLGSMEGGTATESRKNSSS